MRKLSILALAVVLAIASCQKSSVAPSANSSNATSESNIAAKRSNLALLTSHTWMYVRYFTNYTDSAHPGDLVYKRGRANNTMDLDANRVTFYRDGTVNEIDQYGNYVPGTWHFTNDEQTAYVVTNAYGDHYTNIDYLTYKRFEWTGPEVNTHGSMVPAY